MKNESVKGLQHYFGLSDDRSEEVLTAVISAWKENLLNRALTDVNAVKHKTFLDVSGLLRANLSECGVIGIMIEQAYNATREKPKTNIWGTIR